MYINNFIIEASGPTALASILQRLRAGWSALFKTLDILVPAAA